MLKTALPETHVVTTPLLDYTEGMHFAGSDYKPVFDDARLKGQIKRVFELMQDGEWRTLNEIAEATGDPQASISAQLRHLKKIPFGSHTVNKRSRGDRRNGLFEYQLIVRREEQ